MAKILIVEDDEEVAVNVHDYLEGEHHVVENVYNGSEANFRLETYHYDVIVLDINLPDGSGVDICRSYRSRGGTARVIMLTGLDEVSDKERGLDAGADDYLTKPFHPRELSARIRSLMRRAGSHSEEALLKVRDIELDTSARTVSKAGKQIDLLPREFDLLEFFMRNPGETFSQEALLTRVWSADSGAAVSTVRVHVRKLREKLKEQEDNPLIRTLHRQGYKLEE